MCIRLFQSISINQVYSVDIFSTLLIDFRDQFYVLSIEIFLNLKINFAWTTSSISIQPQQNELFLSLQESFRDKVGRTCFEYETTSDTHSICK